MDVYEYWAHGAGEQGSLAYTCMYVHYSAADVKASSSPHPKDARDSGSNLVNAWRFFQFGER
jgi:hypothetical protein